MGTVLPVGVLVSGRGSNLQAIIEAVEEGNIPAEIRVVISNNPDARALERAERYGIPAEVVSDKEFLSKVEYDKRLVDILKDKGVELVALAGFMRILTRDFISTFPQRIINIHPSLLPAFPGLNVQKKAIEYGVKFSGCTVHFVDEGIDTGPIIIQAAVPVHDDDTEETLSERILREEHRIYPQAIQLIAEERLEVVGRRVNYLGR
ncbi:MAG: phosphoribosylglycinamide formyltransferase [Thermodesulfobacteriota bacterium]